jgi:hypothetical protein
MAQVNQRNMDYNQINSGLNTMPSYNPEYNNSNLISNGNQISRTISNGNEMYNFTQNRIRPETPIDDGLSD